VYHFDVDVVLKHQRKNNAEPAVLGLYHAWVQWKMRTKFIWKNEFQIGRKLYVLLILLNIKVIV